MYGWTDVHIFTYQPPKPPPCGHMNETIANLMNEQLSNPEKYFSSK